MHSRSPLPQSLTHFRNQHHPYIITLRAFQDPGEQERTLFWQPSRATHLKALDEIMSFGGDVRHLNAITSRA